MMSHKQRLLRHLLIQRRKRDLPLGSLSRRMGLPVKVLRDWDIGRRQASAEHVLRLPRATRAISITRVDTGALRPIHGSDDRADSRGEKRV